MLMTMMMIFERFGMSGYKNFAVIRQHCLKCQYGDVV